MLRWEREVRTGRADHKLWQKVEQDQDNDRGVVAALSHGNSGSHLLKFNVVLPILNIYSLSL